MTGSASLEPDPGNAAERSESKPPRRPARVEHTLAVVSVSDIDASRSWYERLLGEPPTNTPMATLVEWRTTPNGWLQVFHDPERAGNSLANLAVDDLETYVENVAARGLGPVEIVDADKGVRLATLHDPDGNAVTLIGNFREAY